MIRQRNNQQNKQQYLMNDMILVLLLHLQEQYLLQMLYSLQQTKHYQYKSQEQHPVIPQEIQTDMHVYENGVCKFCHAEES